jgi:hypothetical protein
VFTHPVWESLSSFASKDGGSGLQAKFDVAENVLRLVGREDVLANPVWRSFGRFVSDPGLNSAFDLASSINNSLGLDNTGFGKFVDMLGDVVQGVNHMKDTINNMFRSSQGISHPGVVQQTGFQGLGEDGQISPAGSEVEIGTNVVEPDAGGFARVADGVTPVAGEAVEVTPVAGEAAEVALLLL